MERLATATRRAFLQCQSRCGLSEETDMKPSRNQAKEQQAGFSLIELLITIIVLIIVMGAVFSQINQIQKKTKVESVKLDLTQESRDFMDQFARDLHMCGYPR